MAFVAFSRSTILRPSLSRFASTVNSAVFQKYGNPANVLKMQKTQLREVSSNDVQINMESSTITPFDIEIIYGKALAGFSFPVIGGNEGVGVVEKVGSNVRSIKEHDTVMVIKPYMGCWSEKIVVPEESVLSVPLGVSSNNAASLLNTAGIAYRLLNDFVSLNRDDYVLQNDATTPVGYAVMQLCKKRGIKTINIVKDDDDKNGNTKRVEEFGGDIVIKESNVDDRDFMMLMKNINGPVLTLNGCGGEVMSRCLKSIKNSTIVTYHESSNQAFSMNATMLMRNNICMKGFNMTTWLQNAKKSEVKDMIDTLCIMMTSGELKLDDKMNGINDVLSCIEKGCIH